MKDYDETQYAFILGYLESAMVRLYGEQGFQLIKEAYEQEKQARERDEERKCRA